MGTSSLGVKHLMGRFAMFPFSSQIPHAKAGRVEAAIVASRGGIADGGRLGLPPGSALHRTKTHPSASMAGRVVDRKLFATGKVDAHATFDTGDEQVAQADVGKRAAHHDFMIAAPCAVGVEIDGLHALLDEVAGGRAGLRDVARGRDVVHRWGRSRPVQPVRARR